MRPVSNNPIKTTSQTLMLGRIPPSITVWGLFCFKLPDRSWAVYVCVNRRHVIMTSWHGNTFRLHRHVYVSVNQNHVVTQSNWIDNLNWKVFSAPDDVWLIGVFQHLCESRLFDIKYWLKYTIEVYSGCVQYIRKDAVTHILRIYIILQ